ncbi:LytTR family transcriptional regulator DNA-binding domain-containing protein [Emticicia aquatilis]|nr:LytTR family transcriptional regulator DNA-binding domain-containing protein [Emticicia aquatilis]
MNILRSFFGSISQLIGTFIAAFKKPMATSISSFRGFIISLLVGLFVAIVAVGVQPFGISEFVNSSKTLYLIGFGVVAFVGMLVAKFVLPMILSNFYNDQQWTVARQVVHLTITILIVGTLIMAYSNYFSITAFTFVDILKAVAIAIIPITLITFIQQNLFHNKFSTTAENINSSLESINPPASKQLFPVMVFGESGQKLSLIPNQLIYAETSKDSTDFYWQSLMGVEKTTIQTPLAQVEKELAAHPQFVRLHRNYVINMRGIHKVEGNARGYRLRIARTKHEIPVSWKFHKKLEQIGQ